MVSVSLVLFFVSFGLVGHLTDGFPNYGYNRAVCRSFELISVNKGIHVSCDGNLDFSHACKQ